MYGMLPGRSIEQADADQAYTQALMGDMTSESHSTPCTVSVTTWVRLPPECRPASWRSIRDPVVPLERALYGHPDAGGYWEKKCYGHLEECGFESFEGGQGFSTVRNLTPC